MLYLYKNTKKKNTNKDEIKTDNSETVAQKSVSAHI